MTAISALNLSGDEMNRFLRAAIMVMVAMVVTVGAGSVSAWAQTPSTWGQTPTTCPGGSTGPTPSACIPNQLLDAQFTNSPITVNGLGSEAAWTTAKAQALTIPMNSIALASYPACGLSGTVKALWDGNLLYLLVHVTDPAGLVSGSTKGFFFLDFYNQKWKKYTNSLGAFSVTYNSSGTPTYTTYGVIKDRVNSYAIYASSPNSYNYEVAL